MKALCRQCRATGPAADSPDEARAAVEALGWDYHRKHGFTCLDCPLPARWVWTYRTEDMSEEFRGWRHPLWRGSDDWPGDDEDRYWRRTIVVRIPGRRYLVAAVPIKRKHKLPTRKSTT